MGIVDELQYTCLQILFLRIDGYVLNFESLWYIAYTRICA